MAEPLARDGALPPASSVDELVAGGLDGAVVWCSPRFAARVEARLSVPRVERLADVPVDARVLVAVGGGTRLDEAKHWRRHERPGLLLVAVPTLWGSGAEVSPVVALTRAEGKLVEIDPALRPDARVSWPELAEDLPEELARDACGDAWSHAFEGFFSPLASDELRAEGARLMADLASLPLGRDARWFEASARACALQARSSVGLVHGIAHVLEPVLVGRGGGRGFGHARLCALFLAPVLAVDRRVSGHFDELAGEHRVDVEALAATFGALHEPEAYRELLPVLRERWRDVLRDRCSRTNGALVRPAHLALFEEWAT